MQLARERETLYRALGSDGSVFGELVIELVGDRWFALLLMAGEPYGSKESRSRDEALEHVENFRAYAVAQFAKHRVLRRVRFERVQTECETGGLGRWPHESK